MSDLDYNVVQLARGELLVKHAIYLMKRGAEALQAEHGLEVDGAAGPKTRAVVDALLALLPPKALPVMPAGKGMFIRDLAKAGTRKQVLERMAQCGLSWVAIQKIWQYTDPPNKPSSLYNTKTLAEYSEDLQAAGREVWIWGYPAPGKHQEFVEVLLAAATQVKARGVIVDPEAPYIDQMGAAVTLMTLLVNQANKHGLGVGVTSYGAPWFFPEFPWNAFRSASFGMPQIYDADNNMGKTYPKESVDAWKAKGFKNIVPISAAFNKDKAAMAALLAETPVDGSICWWDWYNCSLEPDRWDALKDYQLKK